MNEVLAISREGEYPVGRTPAEAGERWCIVEHLTEDWLLARNLRDAGCTEAEIRQFPHLSPPEARRFLARKRSELLRELHASQERIDCLDYLVYSMREE